MSRDIGDSLAFNMFLNRIQELFEPLVGTGPRPGSTIAKERGPGDEITYFFLDVSTEKLGPIEFIHRVGGHNFFDDFPFSLLITPKKLLLCETGVPREMAPRFDFTQEVLAFTVRDFSTRESAWDGFIHRIKLALEAPEE